MSRTCRHCGVALPEVADALCPACQHPLDESVEDKAQTDPGAGPFVPPVTGPTEATPGSAAGAPGLAWVWIAGGVYFLFREGWPPRHPVFAVGGGIAIVVGGGLWFVERFEVFRPWRVAIRYIILGVVLAALAAMVAWEVARRPGQ